MVAINHLVSTFMFFVILQLTEVRSAERTDVKMPAYKPLLDQTLLFPMFKKEHDNWGSIGSAVLLENKAVISPELRDARGLIFSRKPNSKKNRWYAAIDFNIGRDKMKEKN